MKKSWFILSIVFLTGLMVSAVGASEDLMEKAQKRFKPIPKTIPEIFLTEDGCAAEG
jgi:hypothetical protein